MSTATVQPHKPRVLVVDDDPITLRICAVRLEAQAVEVVTVPSGEAACALEEPFDLVVVDAHMPDLDGWDTVITLRAQQEHAGFPPARFVMLTTDDSTPARARSRQAGAEEHLVKPGGTHRLAELARDLHDRG